MKNWKTTLMGILTLAGVVGKVGASGGAINVEDLALVSTGIGLILSKDYNVSHTQP